MIVTMISAPTIIIIPAIGEKDALGAYMGQGPNSIICGQQQSQHIQKYTGLQWLPVACGGPRVCADARAKARASPRRCTESGSMPG